MKLYVGLDVSLETTAICVIDEQYVVLARVSRFLSLKSWGVRLAARKGSRKAAVAVARKLAMILFRIWTDATTFRWGQQPKMATT